MFGDCLERMKEIPDGSIDMILCELFEYLIKTYTNEGETVLDNCMGSGSTGVAA
jgi:DNA modification methylase